MKQFSSLNRRWQDRQETGQPDGFLLGLGGAVSLEPRQDLPHPSTAGTIPRGTQHHDYSSLFLFFPSLSSSSFSSSSSSVASFGFRYLSASAWASSSSSRSARRQRHNYGKTSRRRRSGRKRFRETSGRASRRSDDKRRDHDFFYVSVVLPQADHEHGETPPTSAGDGRLSQSRACSRAKSALCC